MRKKKVYLILLILLLVAAWIAFCGYQWSWGPFDFLHNVKTNKMPGNDEKYGLEYAGNVENSLLKGKVICFLGSSVTKGAASGGVSFVDYIGQRNQCEVIKEAVSGTTLVEEGVGSYVSRLKKIDTGKKVDLFVCQLSTNDASQGKELGGISDSFDCSDFDTKTITGAMEYMIAYVKETWNCPVVFYTGTKYESEAYQNMVTRLSELQEKWDIGVINLWDDAEMNQVSDTDYALYMADPIHPTKAGYLKWWTPKIEAGLYEQFSR